MANQFVPKLGEKALVKPKSNRAGAPVPMIPFPENRVGPIRYLPRDAFTRVRWTPYLQGIFTEGNLEVQRVPKPAKASAAKSTDLKKGDD